MKVEIQVDGAVELQRELRDFSTRRLQAAVATALTRTAGAIRTDWQQQLRGELDRPTPLTLRAPRVERATAASPVAVVDLSNQVRGGGDAPDVYLQPHELGIDRRLKKFEQALQTRGAMPRGSRAVPGQYAALDSFGNVRRQQIVQVLNQLGAGALSVGYQRVVGRGAGKRAAAARRAGRAYVAVPVRSGGLEPGIYERRGRAMLPVFFFVLSTRYSRRLSLMSRGQAIAARMLQSQLDRSIGESLARLRARGAT